MKTKATAWYQVRAQEGHDSAEILIYDEIGLNWWGEGIGAQALVEELEEITASTIDVRINSPGGMVFEGLAIYNALVRHESRIVTHVDGLAASIASIVALAGDEVRIADNAFLMVHNAWGVVIGNAADMRTMADVLDKLDVGLAQMYARKSGESVEAALEWMAAETWFNAAEASELGLVDEIENAREEAAAFDLRQYRRVPDRVAARYRMPDDVVHPQPIQVDWSALLEEFGRAPAQEPSSPPPAPASAELVRLALESERTLDRAR